MVCYWSERSACAALGHCTQNVVATINGIFLFFLLLLSSLSDMLLMVLMVLMELKLEIINDLVNLIIVAIFFLNDLVPTSRIPREQNKKKDNWGILYPQTVRIKRI